jgi:hypothetical protein
MAFFLRLINVLNNTTLLIILLKPTQYANAQFNHFGSSLSDSVQLTQITLLNLFTSITNLQGFNQNQPKPHSITQRNIDGSFRFT